MIQSIKITAPKEASFINVVRNVVEVHELPDILHARNVGLGLVRLNDKVVLHPPADGQPVYNRNPATGYGDVLRL